MSLSHADTSHADTHPAIVAPEPPRSTAPNTEVKRAELQELPRGGFSPTAFAGALAIALLLSGGVLKFARWFHQRQGRNRLRAAASWLHAYRQLHDLPEMAGRRPGAGTRPGGSLPQLPTPTDPAHDLKASLRELMRDLRRAQAASEEPQPFAPAARHKLRAFASEDAPRRSYLHLLGQKPEPVTPERESALPSFGQPFVRRRSAAG